VHFLDRILRAPLRSIAISIRIEVRFKDRFQQQLGGCLHHPVPNSRDDQHELHLSPVRLWDGLKSVIRSIRCGASASKYSRNDA
jgi:hypothetical protein